MPRFEADQSTAVAVAEPELDTGKEDLLESTAEAVADELVDEITKALAVEGSAELDALGGDTSVENGPDAPDQVSADTPAVDAAIAGAGAQAEAVIEQLTTLTDAQAERLTAQIETVSQQIMNMEGTELETTISDRAEQLLARLSDNVSPELKEQVAQQLSNQVDADLAERQQQKEEMYREVRSEIREDARDLANVPASELRQAVEERLADIREKHGDNMTQAEWEQTVKEMTEAVTAEREAAMQRELRAAARSQAQQDHNSDPTGGPDTREIRADIQRIAEKYGDVASQEGMAEKIQSTYEDTYSAKRDHEYDKWYDDLAWYEQAYHSVAGWVKSGMRAVGNAISGALDAVVEVGQNVLEGVGAVAEAAVELVVEAGTAVVEGAKAVGTAVVEAVESTVEFVGDAIETVGNGIAAAVDYVASGQILTDIKSASKWIDKQLEKAADYITSGELLEDLGSAAVWVGKGIAKAAEYVASGELLKDMGAAAVWVGKKAWKAVTDPVGSIKAVGSFIYDVADSVGLVKLARGLGHLAATPFRVGAQLLESGINIASDFAKLATGQISAEAFKNSFKDNLKAVGKTAMDSLSKSAQAIEGAVMAVGELTGITDVVMMTKYALEGNWTMAAMHGAFALASAGALVATVATGGAAVGSMVAVAAGRSTLKAAGKQVLKTAAKEFMQGAAKEMGETVCKEVVERVGKEQMQAALKETTQEIVETGSKQLAEIVTREGSQALTAETTEQVMKDVTAEMMEKTLREELNLVDTVRDVVKDKLVDFDNMSPKQMRQMMESMGMSKKQAKEGAASLKKAIKSGKADDELVEIFTEGISKEVTEMIEKETVDTFKDQFAKTLRGEATDAAGEVAEHSKILRDAVQENAERLGKSVDEVTDELVEAGTRGFRKGIREAVEKVVREGVQKAIKEFRTVKAVPRFKGDAQSSTARETELEQVVTEGPEVAVEKAAEKAEVQITPGDKSGTRTMQTTDASGNTRIETQVWSDSQQDFVTVGEQIIKADTGIDAANLNLAAMREAAEVEQKRAQIAQVQDQASNFGAEGIRRAA